MYRLCTVISHAGNMKQLQAVLRDEALACPQALLARGGEGEGCMEGVKGRRKMGRRRMHGWCEGEEKDG